MRIKKSLMEHSIKDEQVSSYAVIYIRGATLNSQLNCALKRCNHISST